MGSVGIVISLLCPFSIGNGASEQRPALCYVNSYTINASTHEYGQHSTRHSDRGETCLLAGSHGEKEPDWLCSHHLGTPGRITAALIGVTRWRLTHQSGGHSQALRLPANVPVCQCVSEIPGRRLPSSHNVPCRLARALQFGDNQASSRVLAIIRILPSAGRSHYHHRARRQGMHFRLSYHSWLESRNRNWPFLIETDTCAGEPARTESDWLDLYFANHLHGHNDGNILKRRHSVCIERTMKTRKEGRNSVEDKVGLESGRI